MQAMHVHISGFVQGVGFRYFAMRKAIALNLTGWVRNCVTGEVEVFAEGERNVLEKFLANLKDGPGNARVLDTKTKWEEASKKYDSFEIR